MTYDEVLGRARGNMGPHCKACPVCNGSGCKNTIPGPGSKGLGTVFPRNYAAWQEIALNMDTICPMEPVDTELTLFGHSFSLPVFAAPIGAVRNHYGDKLTEAEYDAALVRGCREAGIAAFLGDGLADFLFATACHTIREQGFAVPTVKPWSRDLVFRKIDQAKEHGAQLLCMDIDASGLPFLKNMTPPSGTKSVAELKEIMDYAGGSQGSNVFALYLGLVPAQDTARVAARVDEDVRRRGYHLTTGNLMTKYLLEVLTAYGYLETAYRLVVQTTYPSWGYMLSKDATTIWERWEYETGYGMNSHNHPMYGSISAWFYKYLAGISAEAPGFAAVKIQPYLPEELPFVRCSLETCAGRIGSSWNGGSLSADPAGRRGRRPGRRAALAAGYRRGSG